MTPAQIRSICNQAVLTNSYPMIAPAHLLAILDSVEGLSLGLPDNTADCQSLALDHQAAIGRVAALQAELEITDKLLAERNKVMSAIPECPVHGSQCVPHAIEWIEQVQRDNAALHGWIGGRITTDELEEILNKESENVT